MNLEQRKGFSKGLKFEKEISQFEKLRHLKKLHHLELTINLFIKRDDLLHPQISGNKWRKLKYNLLEIKETNKQQLLTFGGAFSNHIAAVAAAGKEYNVPTVGIIRGEKMELLNPTLAFVKEMGMHLKFISRTQYKQKNDPLFLKELQAEFGDFYCLPEGGSNELAVKGCREIISEIEQQMDGLPDYFCVCCGTGGTIAGMIAELKGHSKVIGFSALKGNFLQEEVVNLLAKSDIPEYNNWEINTDYHFGGYAKWKPPLIDFINQFKRNHNIPLDPIYTGKMFYGIFDLMKNGFFEKGATIVAVHTGGLQGIEGFNQRFGDLIDQ